MNEDYKESSDWIRFRGHWLRANPPLDNGYYICGICGHWVLAKEVTLDHIEPRTDSNMFRLDNIQPAHGYCNYNKGSKRWTPRVNKDQYEFLEMMSNM